LAEPTGGCNDGVESRLQLSSGPAYDTKYFRGRPLLLQSLAELAPT
jgi:hypothetical protein